MKKEILRKTIIFNDNFTQIEEGTPLIKLGAGIDGYVYRYEDLAIKILKGSSEERKIKDLMTFEKALYFLNNLSLVRITNPINIILDKEGNYCGYVMKYLEDITQNPNNPLYLPASNFSCESFETSIDELEEDFANLNQYQVKAKDINFGSFIFTEDFMHLCDVDKYQIKNRSTNDENTRTLNYIIAKFTADELRKTLSKEELKTYKRAINLWVKSCANNIRYLETIKAYLKNNRQNLISDYIEEEKPKILKIGH